MANGNQFTRRDIDRAAVISAKIKELTEELDNTKSMLRNAIGPNAEAKGYFYKVTISEVPLVKGKVDYRAELVKAITEPKVIKLEDTAAAKTKDGTPSVKFTVNGDVSPEDLIKSRRIQATVLRAIGEGKAAKELVDELKELVDA